MCKKIISSIIATVLCLGLCPFSSSADEGEMTFFEAREYIFSALSGHEERIVFESGRLRAEVFFACVNDIVCASPFLFYFEGRMDYTADARGYILSAKPLYSMGKEEAKTAREICMRELRRIMLLCPDDASEYEKALFYHDYICANFEYDLTLKSNDLYSFLERGTGNCMSYTQTYMALMQMSGVEVGYAASDQMEHIWNVVCIGGEWYHVDLTWDDAPGCKLSHVGHMQFMFGDETAKKLGYYGWRTAGGVVCERDHQFYGFLSAIIGGIAEFCGEYYYCDGGIYRLSLEDLTEELVDGSSGASCMIVCGGRLLYGRQDGIYSLDGEKIFSAETGICGMCERGDAIGYAVLGFANGREVYGELPLPFGIPGDVDSDGEVGVKDLLTAWGYIEGELMSGAVFCKKAADINADGVIDADDLALMRRKIVTCEN